MSRPKSAVLQRRIHKELDSNFVKTNIKEQTRLQNNLKALGQEETYTMRLLKANSKEIEKYCDRLSEKISKVKSHLKPDEIEEMRKLESAGKLKSNHSTVIPTSASRLAAEARRLRLSSANRPKTSIPFRSKRITDDKDTVYNSENENSSCNRNPVLTKEVNDYPVFDSGGTHIDDSRNTTPSVQDEMPTRQNGLCSPDREKHESYEMSRLNANTQSNIRGYTEPSTSGALSHHDSVEEIEIDDEPESFSTTPSIDQLKNIHSRRSQDVETNEKTLFRKVGSKTEIKTSSPYVKRITPAATKISQPVSSKQTSSKEDIKSRMAIQQTKHVTSDQPVTSSNETDARRDTVKSEENQIRYSVEDQLKKRRTHKDENIGISMNQQTNRPKTVTSLGHAAINKNRRMRSPDGNTNSKIKQQFGKTSANISTVKSEISPKRESRIPTRSSLAYLKPNTNNSYGEKNEIFDSPRLLYRPQTAKPKIAELPATTEITIEIKDADELLKQYMDCESLPNLSNELTENTTLKKHPTSHDISKTSQDEQKPPVTPRSILKPQASKAVPSKSANPYISKDDRRETLNVNNSVYYSQYGDKSSGSVRHTPTEQGNASRIPQRSKSRPQTAKSTSFLSKRKDIPAFNQEQPTAHSTSYLRNDISHQTCIENEIIAKEERGKPQIVPRQQTTKNKRSSNDENALSPSQHLNNMSEMKNKNAIINDDSVSDTSRKIPQKQQRTVTRPESAKPVSAVNISYPYPDSTTHARSQHSIPCPTKSEIRPSYSGAYTYPADSAKQFDDLPPPGPSKVRRSSSKAPATKTSQQRQGGKIIYPEVFPQPNSPNIQPPISPRMIPRPPSSKKEQTSTEKLRSEGDMDFNSSMIPRPKTAKSSVLCNDNPDDSDRTRVVPGRTPRTLTHPNSSRISVRTPYDGYNENQFSPSQLSNGKVQSRPQTTSMRARTPHDGRYSQTSADNDYQQLPSSRCYIQRPQTAKPENTRISHRTVDSASQSRGTPQKRMFDSHAIAEHQARRAESPSRVQSNAQDRNGNYSENGQIDYFEDIQLEIREALLQEERNHRSEMDGRLSTFFDDLKQYSDKSKQKHVDWHSPVSTNIPRGEFDPKLSPTTYFRNRRKSKLLHNKEAFVKHYHDNDNTAMNKCRYVRVPEDRIDVSGVSTLGANQIQLMKTLKGVD